MASLGSLVVSLGLDAAEFTRGLTKSEFQARKFAENLSVGITRAAGVAGAALGALGVAGIAAFAAVNEAARDVSKFKDLEEITGASAEALASFAVAAGTAGTAIETIAGATNKLTKSLTGVDDESQAAGAALAALGIPIQQFKQLDPATQIEAVSQALAKFADGSSKSAVAMALFGKSGAEILPFLKALEEQGGRQVILTQKQIELADQYADRQAELATQLKLYAQVAAMQALPALNALATAANELIGEFIGVDKITRELSSGGAIAEFAETAARALAFVVDAADGVVRVFGLVGKAYAAAAATIVSTMQGDFAAAKDIAAQGRADIDAILNRELFSTKLDRALENAKKQAASPDDETQRLLGRSRTRPRLEFTGAEKAATRSRAQTSEAQRYLETLQSQLDKTKELSAAEQVLSDISRGRLDGLTPKLREQIMATAEQIDAAKRLDKALAEGEERRKAIEEEGLRLTRERASLAAKWIEETTTPLERLLSQYEELNKLLASGDLTAQQYARSVQLVQQRYEEAEKPAQEALSRMDEFAKNAAENIQRSLGQGLVDVMNGNFKSIADSFVQMINRMVAEALAADIARSLFGGDFASGKSDAKVGGLGGKLLGSLGELLGFGSRASGGPVTAGGLYRINERGPEILDTNGKQYLLNGRDQGNIRPNVTAVAPQKTMALTVNVQAQPGMSRDSAMQQGATIGAAIQRSLARNG